MGLVAEFMRAVAPVDDFRSSVKHGEVGGWANGVLAEDAKGPGLFLNRHCVGRDGIAVFTKGGGMMHVPLKELKQVGPDTVVARMPVETPLKWASRGLPDEAVVTGKRYDKRANPVEMYSLPIQKTGVKNVPGYGEMTETKISDPLNQIGLGSSGSVAHSGIEVFAILHGTNRGEKLDGKKEKYPIFFSGED